MRQSPCSPAALCSLAIGLLLAAQCGAAPPAPCEQIVAACLDAGFVKGDARAGYGLWADCVDPLMRGSQQPARADKPLPAVAPDVVAACRQVRPNFGEGHKVPAH